MKLKITVLLFFIATFVGFSQKLNGYKYVIVPKKYDFQKTPNKYQLNSLTKFLFEKEGFNVLYSDAKLPEDLYKNPCLGLEVNVVENSNMFTTKLTIELVSSCEKTTVFTSQEGKSTIKEYKKAHHEALRNAFKSIKDQNYVFDKNMVSESKKEQAIPVTPKSPPIPPKEKSDVQELVEVEELEEVTDEVDESKQNNKDTSQLLKAKELKKQVKNNPLFTTENEKSKQGISSVLYAQNISNGFQLVDSTPKIVFKALKSNTEDLYYLEGHAGVLTKENDKWFAEYYRDGKLIKEELNIKF